ncbi:MAG: hypothetical protein KXJ61_08430 [Hydrogenophaga sp.]|jgi:uncharacterized membrane-anchored protein|nr:hypothetical protein [Hydrogenophaga sp.]MBW0182400.1 hypothetical protein [Hydrogenophaga sp.]
MAQTKLNKVPQVTLYFWMIKIMATTVGETAADFLNTNLNLGLTNTSLVMGVLLLGALVLQFREDRYVPWIYWVAVVLISVVGTLITDNLTDHFGVALQFTTAVFSATLAVTFAVWFSVEKTLSIHTIFTTQRELFYWATILFTFALGTAAGDLLAEQLKLGYLHSAMVFGAGIVVTYGAYRLFNLNAVAAFWIAYILTRPFGASFGDLLSQSHTNGGLGLGTVGTSAIFLSVILVLIIVMTKAQRGVALQASGDSATSQ